MKADLVKRLRGEYEIPVNDGAGPLDGKDTFTRTFPVPPIHTEAANAIEELQTMIYRLSRHIRNTDTKPAVAWGMQAVNLLVEVREMDEERYEREVK